MGTEIAGESEADAGVTVAGAGQDGGTVVLEVPRAEQHVRHGHHVVGAGGDQGVDRLVDRRVGQLEEAADHPPTVEPGIDQIDHLGELLGRGRVAAAVADEQQVGHWCTLRAHR